MSESIVVRKCETLEEFHQCVDLQREVWNEVDLELAPVTIFVVAAHTGGQVLGAFDGQKLVGFIQAVVGLRDGVPYLHSHMAAVDAAYRGRGVGRLLKLFQREEALSRGIRRIEWTFDPLETRNAYFNFNRLGAISRTYRPNAYGITTSPLHRGLPTDRLLAEWHLDSARVMAAIENLAKDPIDAPAMIELPPELPHLLEENSPRIKEVQVRIRSEFMKWFAKGYAVVHFRTGVSGSAYVLQPWSDF